jgi:hypothetical protein
LDDKVGEYLKIIIREKQQELILNDFEEQVFNHFFDRYTKHLLRKQRNKEKIKRDVFLRVIEMGMIKNKKHGKERLSTNQPV